MTAVTKADLAAQVAVLEAKLELARTDRKAIIAKYNALAAQAREMQAQLDKPRGKSNFGANGRALVRTVSRNVEVQS